MGDSQHPHTTVLLLAGGKGTRLAGLAPNHFPKPMIDVNDQPLLHYVMKNARRAGLHDFLFKVGYQHHVIQRYFRTGENYYCHIDYFVEQELLGTAGGLHYLKHHRGPLVILYGDVFTNLNLRRLLKYHERHAAQATLVVHASSHPADSDVVVFDDQCRVTRMIHKPGSNAYGNVTNAALYVLEPECFSFVPEFGQYDFGKDLLPQLLARGMRVVAYKTDEYIKDIGTPDRYRELLEDINCGRALNAVDAVFLDRDGTINREVNLLHRVEDFQLLPGVPEAIARLNRLNIPVIVVTNQPVVARNLCDEATVQRIHERMQNDLALGSAYVDDIFYCPHHPETDHPDANPAYRIACECRKPKTGLLREAQKKYALDLTKCVIVGDTERDVITGRNAGCHTIVVRTGHPPLFLEESASVHPDSVCDTLADATHIIEEMNQRML